MPALSSFPLFWTCAALIVIAQVMILRSTRRAHRHAESAVPAAGAPPRPAPRGAMEWLFAVGPAIAIAFLLFFTWRAATRPPVMEVRFDEKGTISEAARR